MEPQVKTIIPDRPRISTTYEGMLKNLTIEVQKEALKHEWNWHGWADKMQERVK